MKRPPVIGLTLGEPAGIGPELVGRILVSSEAKKLGIIVRLIGEAHGVCPGRLTARSGRQALEGLRASVRLLKSGEIDAVVNGPVHKANLERAGFRFPGQTEFYAHAFGLKASEVTMIMTGGRMTVGLVTAHCSLRQAVRLLTRQRVVETGRRLADFLKKAKGLRRIRLAVAGLNPHAGEAGLFGSEETRILKPAVQALARHLGAPVAGPVSPDVVYRHAAEGRYDGVVCPYHDQGLIPFKLLCFENGVNFTAGLPVLRAAPDHGTALDIAGKNLADPSSLLSALRLTAGLLRNQKRLL
jgi:4-hydroxythreonine-4-phosphate dehydrogenase